jgi:hypothetical protein
MTCEIGDWVRFYKNGVLVLGIVEYRAKDPVLGEYKLSTDVGSVYEEQVLERRRHDTGTA